MRQKRNPPSAAGLLCACLLIAFAHNASAQQLSLPQITLPRDGSAVLSLSFDSFDQPAAGIQFDLDYDHSAIELIPLIGNGTRLGAKSLDFRDVSTTKRRFIISGLNQTLVRSGNLIDFLAGTKTGAALQTYPVSISGTVIVTPEGFLRSSSSVSGGTVVTAEAGMRLTTAGVRNAASLLDGPISPREVTTLFGTGIGPDEPVLPASGQSSPELGGTTVWFGGIQAPLLFADASQISAVVPPDASGDQVRITIKKGVSEWGSVLLPLRATVPGIFTQSWSGSGPALIINEDATINDLRNPAAPSSVVSFFATGAGEAKVVGVQVGGVNAEVLHIGPAAGLIEGIVQVNVRVPKDAPQGPAVEIVLVVGDAASPAGVTLAIR